MKDVWICRLCKEPVEFDREEALRHILSSHLDIVIDLALGLLEWREEENG